MKRTIVNPHWTNNARTILAAEFHYEDGRVVHAVISDTTDNNADWVEVKKNFSTEQLELNTRKRINEVNNENARKKEQEEAQAQRKIQEELFAAKLKIFEVDAIKNSTNRVLKSKIRKSKSDVEALAYAAALLLDTINNPQPVVETPAETDTTE